MNPNRIATGNLLHADGRHPEHRIPFVALLILWLVAPVPATARGGYLQQGAPKPLKWCLTEVTNREAVFQLPPLDPGKDPALKYGTNSPPESVVLTPVPSPTAEQEPAQEPQATNTEANPVPSDLLNRMLVPPPGTNFAPRPVLPMIFLPPVPINPVSSTATYATDKQ
jgi:hypothetical protein